MKAKEIVARAQWYEQYECTSAAERLLSVLIDLFTDETDDNTSLDAKTVQQAWERLTRDLSALEWLEEYQTLMDGIDVLAGNLAEAGRRDLAATLRRISQPRFEGAARSSEVESDLQRRLDEVPNPRSDGHLWVPRGAGTMGYRV